MRIEEFTGDKTENRVVTALIVDQAVLSRIAPRWNRELFATRWASIISSWCVKYYIRHQKAPGKHIQSLFEVWAEKFQDKNIVELVSRFLSSLSGDYESLKEESNSDYIIDLAEKHFKRVGLERLAENIKADLDNGDLDKAEERRIAYKPVEISPAAGIDVLRDKEALIKAFEQKADPLIEFHGPLKPLNKFFYGALERDSFIGIMAAEKRGKSWLLMELAWKAMLQRRKVAFFACGDMSQSQMIRRWAVRAAKKPLSSRDGWPCKIKWPVSLVGGEHADVTYEEKEFDSQLDWQTAWKGYKDAIARIKSHDPYLRLSCHPSRSISVKGIEGVLQGWDRDGWSPDCICIDYADILDSVTRNLSPIDKINEDWSLLRGLSQSRHCLVLTATQVNVASYSARTLSRRNFAGSHTKFGHVTGMIGISAEEEERGKGLFRLNWIQLREGSFSEHQCAHVAGCLALANPMVRAVFGDSK